jgi:hypothetical protein
LKTHEKEEPVCFNANVGINSNLDCLTLGQIEEQAVDVKKDISPKITKKENI